MRVFVTLTEELSNLIEVGNHAELISSAGEDNRTVAIVAASRLRLRPILMTTFTTIPAMLPLAVGIGVGAEIQAALARVVIGGLLASTLIILFLIPIIYLDATHAVARVKEYREAVWQQIRDRFAGEESGAV